MSLIAALRTATIPQWLTFIVVYNEFRGCCNLIRLSPELIPVMKAVPSSLLFIIQHWEYIRIGG